MCKSPQWGVFPEIGWKDFGFEWSRVLWPSDTGAPTHRWVPSGMPRLRPNIADGVFYLYRPDPEKPKRKIGPLGTGFIVVRESKRREMEFHYYAVTNWHVAQKHGATDIRLNTKDGKTRFLEYDQLDWQFVRNGDDICAVDITDDLQETDQIAVHNETGFLTQAVMDRFKLGLGEDVFMIGLFSDQHGGKRNKPAARFGNISLLADKDALIKQPNGIRRPSHLLDMRSRTGFSGSPVTVYRVPGNNLSNMPPTHEKLNVGFSLPGHTTSENYFTSFLGIHCGQFWDRVEVYKKPPDSESEGDLIREGDKLYIQSGLTIVAPASAVSELLDLEVFEVARKKRDESNERSSEPRGEAVEDHLATDENPNHREGFNSLVDVAARKQPQGD
jgi:hypothetical protein